jgi:putative membrane protein
VPFLVRVLVNAAALWVASRMVGGVMFHGNWLALLAVALVFSVVNAVIKPVTKFVTFPLIVLTLGFFLLVINGLMLKLTSALSGALGLGFTVHGFWAAFWGGLVVTIVNAVASMAFKEQRLSRGFRA